MPNDPIERWEWEGGAAAVDASDVGNGTSDGPRGQPVENPLRPQTAPPPDGRRPRAPLGDRLGPQQT